MQESLQQTLNAKLVKGAVGSNYSGGQFSSGKRLNSLFSNENAKDGDGDEAPKTSNGMSIS